jgi:hypothetical protein
VDKQAVMGLPAEQLQPGVWEVVHLWVEEVVHMYLARAQKLLDITAVYTAVAAEAEERHLFVAVHLEQALKVL